MKESIVKGMNKNFKQELMDKNQLDCEAHEPKTFVNDNNHAEMNFESQKKLILSKDDNQTLPEFFLEHYKKDLNLPQYAG